MTAALRIPVSAASSKGVSGLIDEAEVHRIVLNRHGRVAAVIDSADRLDADVRRLREATNLVLDLAANLVSDRTAKRSLDEVCAKLGIDIERITAAADQEPEL